MTQMAVAVMTGASSCSSDKEDSGDAALNVNRWASLVNETKHDIQVDGTKVTYGTHTYSLMDNVDGSGTIYESSTASVNFSHIPSVYAPQAVTGGTDTFLYILTFGGWDSAQRQVEIFQKNGSDHYTVYNCPSVYAQCKPIVGTWAGLR